MPTPKSPIFRAKKPSFTAPEVKATIDAAVAADPKLDKLDFQKHIAEVEVLSSKIVDLFDQHDYDAMVALDALEIVLKSGISVTLGEDAGVLLTAYLRKFHKELAALQIMKLITRLAERGNAAAPDVGGTDQAKGALDEKLNDELGQ